MAERESDQQARRSQSRAAKLKRLGLIILVGGFIIAGVIYLLAPNPTSSEDPMLTGYYDQQTRAAQRILGNQGSVLLDLIESLKHMRTYVWIVAGLAILGSFACFYLSMDAGDGRDG